ncbi:hypothetical protein [Nocardia caishijiensis]|uniref:Secreted protein n=1 Tax=Nocardia caishijiensis TaxID=184756 RepID=A0ABQ6YH22_9NOCA|nr:hypothetical protein [Nocardia caishijiensis]KAF0845079.1 hypothetical protein FNL39_109108 [Nocardia caishijiensis]
MRNTRVNIVVAALALTAGAIASSSTATAAPGAGTWGPYSTKYGCESIRRMDALDFPQTRFSDCFEILGEGWYYVGS